MGTTLVLGSETGFHTERHRLPASTLTQPGKGTGRLCFITRLPAHAWERESLMSWNRASADRSALHKVARTRMLVSPRVLFFGTLVGGRLGHVFRPHVFAGSGAGGLILDAGFLNSKIIS